MATDETTVHTTRGQRYANQLAKHAAAMSLMSKRRRIHGDQDTSLSDPLTLHVTTAAQGCVIDFGPRGRCEVRTGDTSMSVRIDASSDETLRMIKDIITRDLERFGRREGLVLTWRSSPDLSSRAPEDEPAVPSSGVPGTPHRPAGAAGIVAATAAAIVICLHLGIGGVTIAGIRGLGWPAAGTVAVVVGLVITGHAAVPITALRLRRHLHRRG